MMGNFAYKWFALYYPVLGLLFLAGGIGLMIKTDALTQYLQSEAQAEQPPAVPRTIVKYFFFFTLACLVLSFFPFSWPELLFSIWSLVMVYIAGLQLIRWNQRRQTIKNNTKLLRRMIAITGAIMMAVSPVMFLLGYLVMRRVVE